MKSKRPDYQVLHPRRGWKNGGGLATFTPFDFKPARLFTLAESEGFVCLMTSLSGNRWIVYSMDAARVPARSTICDGHTLGEEMFHELCHRLVCDRKDTLVKLLSELQFELAGKDRADASLELARLELADDDLYHWCIDEAERFCQSHTARECEAEFQKELESMAAG